jgi:hypothetical protein
LVSYFTRVLRGTLHEGASDILGTKIILGTMGCVPAFDTSFKKGFGVATFGRKSLMMMTITTTNSGVSASRNESGIGLAGRAR